MNTSKLSMFQHRWPNIDSDTIKTTKPTKTSKIHNRQKSFVNVVNKTKTPKNFRATKTPKNPDKNSRPPKIPDKQKTPQ
jgi:hypothetical protein